MPPEIVSVVISWSLLRPGFGRSRHATISVRLLTQAYNNNVERVKIFIEAFCTKNNGSYQMIKELHLPEKMYV
ncbi:hypothetical protein JMG10_22510 [Nostoc ellipsosporum NOK]|nr:hypothetical protein [Nostoc ellipsosporum NOK]